MRFDCTAPLVVRGPILCGISYQSYVYVVQLTGMHSSVCQKPQNSPSTDTSAESARMEAPRVEDLLRDPVALALWATNGNPEVLISGGAAVHYNEEDGWVRASHGGWRVVIV